MHLVDFSKAKELIKEGDILLFRGSGLISFLITRYTGGVHSHVAIAHWDDDVLECVEFREFIGGRTVVLKGQVKKNPKNIDVFRPVRSITYDQIDGEDVVSIEKNFTEEVSLKTSKDIIRWTGQRYGWKNILGMFIRFVPGLRLLRQNTNDEDVTKAKVCSTAVALSLRNNFIDPVPFLADDRVSPADLARSPLLQYLFTIKKDW